MAHLLDRRRAVARTTLLVHVTALVVLLILMAGTEGPAAHGTATSLTLARLQLFLLAVAGLVQIFMAGRWTQYALLLRQASADEPPRTGRGEVRVLMTMMVAAAWLAEISLVPVAVYQVEHGGRGEPDLDFTIGMVVLFMVVTASAAMTTGHARPGVRPQRPQRSERPLRPQRPRPPRHRAAEATALLRVRVFAGLATLIALGFLGAAAAGRLGAIVGFTAIGLFFASLCVAAHWQRVLDSTRQHEEDLVSPRARAR